MLIEIDKTKIENIKLLEKFINSMGNSSDSFRYFKSRSISAINNHLCTVLLMYNNEPIGYGHLDKEEDDIWFGIAIVQDFLGSGNGTIIINYLINKANDFKVPEIKLSVDANNLPAINLYTKHGFVKNYEQNGVLFFSRKILL